MSRKSESIPGLDIRPAPDGAPVLIWVDPKSIHANESNWRVHTDDQRALVGDSIDDPGIGWAGVCLFNKRTGEFIDGHLRREHAIQAGITSIPVFVGDWSPEKQAAIHASLDMSTGMAKVDVPRLLAMCQKAEPPSDRAGDILRRLAEKGGVVFPEAPAPDDDGSSADPETGDAGPTAADRIEALRAKWGCEPGQVWGFEGIGGRKHRIAIGDSSHDDVIAKLFGDARPDVVMTSPPYDDQRDYVGKVASWDDTMQSVFGALPHHDDTQLLVNLGLKHKDYEVSLYWLEWTRWMRSRGWRWFAWYVWDQGCGLPGQWYGRLMPSHELVFHFNKQSIEPNRTTPAKEAGKYNSTPGLRSADGKNKSGYEAGCGISVPKENTWMTADFRVPDSVIRACRASNQGIAHLHPALYSVEFARKLIDVYSQPDGLVYDPFGGAMTTILASEASGRVGYASEIAPGYVAIGLERFAGAGFKPALVR